MSVEGNAIFHRNLYCQSEVLIYIKLVYSYGYWTLKRVHYDWMDSGLQ